MTIDEAIKDLRYDAQCNRADLDIEWAERNEQLAEWLELLKWYQQGMEDIPSESGVLPKDVYRAGYIKGIQDFTDKLSKYLDVENATKYGNENAEQQRNSYDTLMKYEIAWAIDDVAEQLKEGIEE